MPRPLALASLALLSALGSGCRLLNDLDDLRGGAGGSDGDGGGQIGGAAPNPCAAGFVRGVCGVGQKCTLTAPGQGLPGGVECGPSGEKKAWSVCASDAECPDGSWCDELASTCKPWCQTAEECPAGGSCVGARHIDNTPLPGVTVCTAHCALENDTLCGAGANCVIDDLRAPEGDCVKAGDIEAGCYCAATEACIRGTRRDDSDNICKEWCQAGNNATCAGGQGCGPAIVSYDGTDFALCQLADCTEVPGS